jgi:hypothetical protein
LQNPRKTINFALVIELERHIEILLLNNDCVIVPDLGGFMAHYSEAHYDDRDQMFLPPMRTLGFNPALKMNDSLLAQSYIEAYDISYPEAILRIEDEVSELRQHIENEGSYELNDLGILKMNEYGNYEFEPCEAGILTPTLYGLSTVEMEPLANMTSSFVEAKTRPIKVESILENDAKETVHEEKAQEVEMSSSYFKDDNDDKVHIPVSVLRNIMAAAIAIFGFFLISTPLNNGSSKEMSMLNFDTETLTRILPKATIQGNAEVKGLKASEVHNDAVVKYDNETTDKTNQQDIVSVERERTVPYYTIVLASQVSKKNASLYVEKLHKAGFNEAKIFTSHSSTRVIFNRYKTEAEAYNALREMREYTEFHEAWVYQVKH